MKKIYESPFNSWDEEAEMLIIYELDENEYLELHEEYEDETGHFDHERMLYDMGYYSDWGEVMPGALYTRFYVESLSVHHLVIARVDALNV